MQVDWTINLSTIISLLIFAGFFLNSSRKLGKIELKIDLLWDWFKKEKGVSDEAKD